jgi:hypothetical protein
MKVFVARKARLDMAARVLPSSRAIVAIVARLSSRLERALTRTDMPDMHESTIA